MPGPEPPRAVHALQLSPNARVVLEARYLRRDATGQPSESPEGLFRRVARSIAQVDRRYDEAADVEAREREFYNLMADLEFLPNTPTLMNAGTPLGQLAACFVLPVADSMEGIFRAVAHAALIHKSGGGTGFAFSRLRPANDIVQSTHGVSSGPVSFMRVFDVATETIKQGGARRGANMAILRVDHPDILEFVHCKHGGEALTNFNISVGVTNAFMHAVQGDSTYPLINPRDGSHAGEQQARAVWDAIVEEAWSTGDPGLVFLDRVNADNPTPALGAIEATNPCGEQPLLPYEACNLGSVNLGRMVVEQNNGSAIDYPRFDRVIRAAVHFLDNVVDANRYPLPEIESLVTGNRKIGLGVMGFADMLIRLDIPYDSDAALETAESVARFLRSTADDASRILAEERGVFPNWEQSVYGSRGERVRNATRTTVAPTGTISIIAGATGGIEPLFGLVFVRRNILDGTPMSEVHPLFADMATRRHFHSEALMADVAQRGTLRQSAAVPDNVRRLFVTAHEVAPEWHVRMQAAFQRHTDNGVSKTVNLPRDATRADVRRVYLLAYELGCKGVTVYRDHSRNAQVLNLPTSESPVSGAGNHTPSPKLSEDAGDICEVPTADGCLGIAVQCDAAGVPTALVLARNETSLVDADIQALCKITTVALRSGAALGSVIDSLAGTGVAACAVAQVLRTFVPPDT